MYKKIVASVAALTVQGIAGAALAQAQPLDTIDPNEILAALDADTVAPALAVVTVNSLVQVDEAGNQFVTATAGNRLTFEIHFASCAQPQSLDCKAMYMMAFWDAVDPAKQVEAAALVNEFQMQRPIVSTGFMPDGKPYLLRFVIADYGIQQGNVLSEFSNFIQNATDFHNLLQAELPQETEE